MERSSAEVQVPASADDTEFNLAEEKAFG